MRLVAADEELKDVPLRTCGRCRKVFEGDPALHPTAIPEWWACPPCRLALLGPTRPQPSGARAVAIEAFLDEVGKRARS